MLEFKPLSKEDYVKRTRSKLVKSFLKSGYDVIEDSLESESSFGEAWSRTNVSAERDNCRNYITLALPVLNMFNCQSDGRLLKKVLGLPDAFLKGVLSFNLVYSLDKKAYVHASDLDVSERFLASGQIIEMIIDSFNINQEIEKEFLSLIRKKFYKSTASLEEVGYIDKDGVDGYELLGDYYFHPNVISSLKKTATLSDITPYIQSEYMIKNKEPRITYLLNVKKERMYSFINKDIMVVPPGLRPRLGKRNFDNLTMAYAKIIEANAKLQNSLTNQAEPNLVLEDYKKLHERILELQCKTDEKNVNEFSIKELIAGKGRHIRGEMLSKRADYSGRSALSHDPRLRPDQIGIPIAMIPKLFAYHYVKNYPNKLTQFMAGKIPDKQVVKDLKKAGVFDYVPVLLNRQPTLHKLGYQAFYCVPIPVKAIRVSSLINESYNADFDGDQAQVNVPLSEEAILDAQQLLYCMHNLYKPSTGKCVVNLRLDMIYGWYIATRYSIIEDKSNIIASYDKFICNDSERYNVSKNHYDNPSGMGLLKFKDDANKPAVPYGEFLYNDLYRNRISVYDTIKYKGEVGTAGRLALKAILGINKLPICPFNKENISIYKNLLYNKDRAVLNKLLQGMLELSLNMHKDKVPKDSMLIDYLKDTILKAFLEYFSNKELNDPLDYIINELLTLAKDDFINLFKNSIDEKSYAVASNTKELINFNASTVKSRIEGLYSSVFGIVTSSSLNMSPKESISSFNELKDKILNKELLVSDYVSYGGKVDRVGNLYAESIVGDSFFPPLEVTSKSIDVYMQIMLKNSVSKFTEMLHHMTMMAFRLAKLYNPVLDVFETLDVDFESQWEEFHNSMKKVTELYDDGFLTEETYTAEFDDKYKVIDKKLGDMAMDLLSNDNGFKLMALSGARGSKSNVMQIFTHKGRIAKPDGSAFNSAIEHSFIYQLSPLEHGVSAAGARKGMLDKSVKPGETGYVERMSWHSTGDFKIVTEDCGTTEGLTWSLKEIQEFDTDITSSPSVKASNAKKKLKDLILNRYEAVTNRYIDEQYADELIATKNSVTVRSIATCKNPCCAKCYGMDLTTNAESLIGETIGVKAAQSIGEPGTQLVMRTFHAGGVAGRATMGSSFDRLQNYIKLASTITKDPMYCPTAWATGKVIEIATKDKGVKKLRIVPAEEKDEDGNIIPGSGQPDGNYSKSSSPIDESTPVKEYVHKGEGMLLYGGDRYIKEIEEYSGILEAIKYHILMCYTIYEKDAKMNVKNFEMLAASLVMAIVIKTDNPELKVGQHYTMTELAMKGDLSGTKLVRTFRSALDIPIFRESPLANIAMENVGWGLARALLLGNKDALISPMRNVMIGLEPKVGSYYKNYIEKRKELLRDF